MPCQMLVYWSSLQFGKTPVGLTNLRFLPASHHRTTPPPSSEKDNRSHLQWQSSKSKNWIPKRKTGNECVNSCKFISEKYICCSSSLNCTDRRWYLCLIHFYRNSENMVQERCKAMDDDSKRNQIILGELLENFLFTSAPTMNDYKDKSRIESKIKDISIRILKRRLEKRQRKLGGFRSSIVLRPRDTSTIPATKKWPHLFENVQILNKI